MKINHVFNKYKIKYILTMAVVFLCSFNYFFTPSSALSTYSYRFEGNKNETWIPIGNSFHFNLRLWAVTPNQYIGENLSKMGITEDNMMDGTWMVAMQSGLCYEDYINNKEHLLYNTESDDRYASANVIERAFQYNTDNPYYNASFNELYSMDYEQYEEVAFFQCNTTLMNLPNTHIDRKMPSFTYEQWLKRMYIIWCYDNGPAYRFDDELADEPSYIEIIENNIRAELMGSEAEKDLFFQEARSRAYAYSQCSPYTDKKMYADGGIPNADWIEPYSYQEEYTSSIKPQNQYLMNDTDINRDPLDEDFGRFEGGQYVYYGGEYGIWENGETLEFTSPRLTEGYYSFLVQFAEFDEEARIQNPKLNLIIWVHVTDEPKPQVLYLWDIVAVACIIGLLVIIYDFIPKIKRSLEVSKLNKTIPPDNQNPSICHGGESECYKDEYKRPLIAVPGTDPCLCALDTQANRKEYYTNTYLKQQAEKNAKKSVPKK